MSSDTGPHDGILRSWLHAHLGSIYGTAQPKEEDFKALFHATFTESAVIRHNHELVSQETFLERLAAANFASTQAEVGWWDEQFIVIPSGGDSEGGIISGGFNVTRSLKFRIRAGPAQRQSLNIFSAKVEDLGIEGVDNQKKLRISELFITSVDKAVPVHLPGIPTPLENVNPSVLEKTSG